MKNQKKRIFLSLMLGVAILVWGVGFSDGAQKKAKAGKVKAKRITQAQRQEAAKRAATKGFVLPKIGEATNTTIKTTVDADSLTQQSMSIMAMDMTMPADAPHYFSHPNYANSPLPRNIVAEWNAIAQEILQPAGMQGMPMGGTSMSAAFVYLSYVQGAVYNSLVAIEGGYTPYKSSIAADPNASRDAAVAAAAYGVLKNYFPMNAVLDEKYTASLAAIPDNTSKTDGIAVGEAAAAEMIALRSSDVLAGDGGYILPDPGPGIWEPTATMPDGVTPAPPMDPWMAELQPFLRDTASELRPVPPPALTSDTYTIDFNEVKEIGGAISMTRTPEQTEVARFWATNMVIQTNFAYRQVAESRGLGLLETARLMALGNMAATDSLIATFDAKYHYNFWRPVTAINKADTDGNDLTGVDPAWAPVLATPNFPEYVAGHTSFVSAQAEVFEQVFGTPQIEIDLESKVTNTIRHYATVEDLRIEIVNARTWGGLHFRHSSELGLDIGRQIVLTGTTNYFTSAPDLSAHVMVSGGIRKFVDTLPGLGAGNANNLGQYIPVGMPDTTTYPGSDYYEIAAVQYREKMHSDLPATLLRGYVQISTPVVPGDQVPLTNALLDGTSAPIGGYTGVTPPHYLGPTIVATKDRPVRIKFYNLLPTGMDGDLFLPVDTTVMGSGMGPEMTMPEMDPQNPMCGNADKPYECYTENRATLHLHGGISPWISDGTPHQWITPADEVTPYPQGVSVVPVPDMDDSGDPNDGVMTFYYTNQQSARLMFYHDHAWGITRLNVYAGEAAPYIIQDDTETELIDQGLIPAPEATIPLVVQDKTFVPSQEQLAVSDETWDAERWGGMGNLWLPHVYSPAQNPGDSSGVNQFGRWAYGPWFWPPTNAIAHGPIDNPYYCGPDGFKADGITPCDMPCDPDVEWCEPPMMPGTPYNSMGMEAFNDTPVVNGTVYPTVTVEPKAYRLRILNAASDRFFNLSLFKADPNAPTEVALNAAEVAAALDDPAAVFPTPDTAVSPAGPNWIQIGTEGGFLPTPVVIPAQHITWVSDPTVFNAGNVDKHSLLIAPAERADVIVDFSQYAGQTLILYNDAPAAFPARDPRYDYYTGNADLRDTGGAPSTLPGYGPNIRTVMQIKVGTTTTSPSSVDLAQLQAAFSHQPDGSGVFESGQHPIIVGQGAYNSAYGTNFRNSGPLDGFARITDFSLKFRTLNNWTANATLTLPFQPKAIQDEMGEAFDQDYGRMSGSLGVEVPLTGAGTQQNLVLYPYVNPSSELIDATNLPTTIDPNDPNYTVQPISVADDGTQIWKITHNGVDTHPIHFHLFDVQMLNRVGWDGIIRKPDPNELGWKDTIRVSPLEDTIVALRPIMPVVPFELPNSVRPLNPMMPLGSTLMFNSTDANAAPTVPIINALTNFGWEYVWHCHILSHEEMDMMRPISVAVPPNAPSNLMSKVLGTGRNRRVVLNWIDNSGNETGFIVQRGTDDSFTINPTAFTVSPDVTTYADRIGNTTQTFYYRVIAANTVGYNSTAGYPSKTATSGFSNITAPFTVPTAPTAVSATAALSGTKAVITVSWADLSNNESGFRVQRATNPAFTTGVVTKTVATNVTTFTTGNVSRNRDFYFRVQAYNGTGASAWVNAEPFPVHTP